jgi:hypothetical protein
MAGKKPGKNTGKLTETKITVFLATDEALGDRRVRRSRLAFLEDDLTYSFNKVQEGKDVQGVSSHSSWRAPEDAAAMFSFRVEQELAWIWPRLLPRGKRVLSG